MALQTRSTAGRGSSGKIDLYGIKKLRELILELAVRGKLVQQDPNDEPASGLLKRIAAEKAGLVKQGKIKKSKPLPEISEEEKPFELPVGWEWVRLPEITHYQVGKTPSTKDSSFWGSHENGIPWVSISDLVQNGIVEITSRNISKKAKEDIFKYPPVPAGTILMSFKLTVGKTSLLNIDAYHNEAIISIHEMNGLNKNYLFHLLPLISQLGTTKQAIMGNTLNSESLSMLVVPVPSTKEQIRIVKKYEELMSLCDQLEQHSLTSLDAHQQLVETLLTTLTDSQNADELAENWARISEHFDTLFTTEASIDALKQTILQLAVMGKLVPQDPNDEPAVELLKRIEQEKAQLVKDGKIKKQKPLPPISDEEKPFELPDGWEWCKFGLISEFINGDRGSNYPNKNEYVVHGIPWINTGHIEKNGTLSITDMNFITEKKFNELRSGKIQSGDLVYCLRGATFGKTAFVMPYESGAIASSLMIIRPFIKEMGEHIYNYLISPFGRSQIFRFDNGSAQPNLSANSVMLYAFACPPLQEQFRIHKKITELFHICDSLRLQTQSAQQTQLHLADALTDAAIN